MSLWIDSVMRNDRAPTADFQSMLFTFFMAFVMGQVVGWVYQRTHSGLSYSQSFTASMVTLPILVAMMMLLMADNLSIAFGLLAVFAVVRFRNVLKDTRDTVFVLWSIVEGMAVGTGRSTLALVGSVFIGAVMFYLYVTQYGARHNFDTIVNLMFNSDSDEVSAAIDRVLNRHSLTSQLASAQEVSPGNVDVSYRLTLRNPARRLELESELRGLDQVQRVSIFAHEDESEA
ncbi:DUF4956 domain-containing protein [Stieleria sp. TO1_6]|uniref:DUF4956 domain-containing protein n=1 Tax=Stieleria tagensis TaxID=2956795 RepID=UPI00209B0E21|nr:DUF4956 domain-containing protein [Stieleria tagensis]MCO8125442.1 DUF4956 domain-containing protein [Stieleria tagensis]